MFFFVIVVVVCPHPLSSFFHQMADPVPEYIHLNNQIPTKENIALFEAAVAGDFNRVKTLLKQGAKPNFFHRPEDQKNVLQVG